MNEWINIILYNNPISSFLYEFYNWSWKYLFQILESSIADDFQVSALAVYINLFGSLILYIAILILLTFINAVHEYLN